MNISFGHIGINVRDLETSKKFYDSLFNFLGAENSHIGKNYAGWFFKDFSLWLHQVGKPHLADPYDEKHLGMQHIAFRAKQKSEVDELYHSYLLPKKIPILYNGPAEYPQYTKGYYAVFFLDPDGIKLELMWTPE
ncbi:hypothetical protein A2631_06050 [Candidatus Daviesbacteria bacterium RIFCSPHIGHO2_01_FULL_44_29]|uniref:VOC domain-containing protein n=1 Tax=Candidatus Daviesbacteria bacterium RIFCSPHIGHO2_02_FULL_43_12 TaxID=1797776 RepID=A0A1F5KJ84_9BACT|nr:MAG: hypothetical protein A2631_06050 [Candidatus Daviesbacteria bacterium RIFCSPHIGHO2_01_FULL_44_29]OGE39155.1 MAG: hypothetical protein A3E86_03380 [Candidatus Daviesbacteria bacterium RIFCSPHIGHO2_12_FULL_47_45]OGE40958.1 MAG: hypothetical protein A3D25_02880 [Candidatus Daviesbacteria bacterium RIFCSPHIGHO2_02_FULL_43_12]OGE69891.1 MAG: hypothetical protein A3B55_05790 [Candidatus Daviesbacteria bacterium RIFCSPLOWO2_01_FULL_43_15]